MPRRKKGPDGQLLPPRKPGRKPKGYVPESEVAAAPPPAALNTADVAPPAPPPAEPPAEPPTEPTPRERYRDPLQAHRDIRSQSGAELKAYARQIGVPQRDVDFLTEDRLRQNCLLQIETTFALLMED